MGWDIVSGPQVGQWVAKRINGVCYPGTVGIGLERDGKPVAGVMYEQWNGRSIVAHIAIDGRITPAYLAAIFDYPFNVCGAHKVMCPIPSDNTRSIKLATNMGFSQEARIKDAAPSGDILVFTLTKAECSFLKERYGKKFGRAAARA